MHKYPVEIRLPKAYNIELLQRDLEQIKDIKKLSQPGPYHNGEWAGVSLYATGGVSARSAPGPGVEPFRETEIVKRTPYFKEVLDSLLCPKLSVRLLWLPLGGKIGQHSDGIIGFNSGFLRLHIPIITHPDVVFVIANHRCQWKAGELWYGDFSQVHSVENRSSINRVHMVLDVEINDFILNLFPKEFIYKKRQEGITMVQEPINMTEEELSRYVCSFKMPRNKGPISPGRGTVMDEARIDLMNDRLVFFVNGRPELSLQPLSEKRFAFVGCPSLSLKFEMDRDKPYQLNFLFRRASAKENYTIRVRAQHND